MEKPILALRTVTGFIFFGIGIASEWVGNRFMDIAVWLTQDNEKWKFHKIKHLIEYEDE